jgi:hypothetical protein
MHRDQGFESSNFDTAVATNLGRLRSGVDFSVPEGPGRWSRHFAACVDRAVLKFSTHSDAGYYDA